MMIILPRHYEFGLHVNKMAQQIKVMLGVFGNLWGAFPFPLIRGLSNSNIIIPKTAGTRWCRWWDNGDVNFLPLSCLTAFNCYVTYSYFYNK